ncbi:MAG: glutamine synthetase family protein [Nocardiaceae bacterium]|nr:glutamine synthetase family protein [Nocardiaceae bacterium]
MRASELREQGVTMVLGTVVDMAGVARAKWVPVSRVGDFEAHGMGACPSWNVFCIDSALAFTKDLNVIGDLRIRIDTDRLAVIDDGIAWAPGSFFNQDGTPNANCARTRLAEVCSKTSYRATVGAELEFALLGGSGQPVTTTGWTGYGARSSLEQAPFFDSLLRRADRAQLGIEQFHAEAGVDQFEISLSPADPVAAADAVVLARILIGRAAAEHGMRVSFSPLPFAGGLGNGAHLHMSLRSNGSPVFSGGAGPHALTEEGGNAIGGVLESLPELQAIFAGSVLSPARIGPGKWSGAARCWGLENREAAVRFVAATPSNPHGANIELKVVDPSANPYLAIAAFVGSALRGISQQTPLPPEESAAPTAVETLTGTQAEIIAAFADSPVAKEVLGEAIVEALVSARSYEIEQFSTLPLEDLTEKFREAWSY